MVGLLQIVLNLSYRHLIHFIAVDIEEQRREGDVVLTEGVEADLTQVLIVGEDGPVVANALRQIAFVVN